METVATPSMKKQLLTKAASFFANKLNPGTKRMIFISTLAGYLKQYNQSDPIMLNKLNELFSLSGSPKALEYPMTFHSKIWGKFDIEKLNCIGVDCKLPSDISSTRLAFSQRRRIAQELVKFVPDWLRYGSLTVMQNDVILLLNNLASISPDSTSQTA